MTTTDIRVLGSARDSRTADRAEICLKVSKWGRDWDYLHQSVMTEVNALLDNLTALVGRNPQSLQEPVVSRVSQKTWNDTIGVAYSEAMLVSVIFTDFQVMSQWVFALTNEHSRSITINWKLSRTARNDLNIALGVEAVRDAQRRAETLAAAANLRIIGIQQIADPEMVRAATPAPIHEVAEAPAASDERQDSIDITPAVISTEVRVAVHFVAKPAFDSDPVQFETPSTRSSTLFFA